MLILAGFAIILAVTAATAFFVAQEFAYVAVDRSRLEQMSRDGDRAATAALQVTSRLSFMLSGAQLGITVTALFVGFFAEPYLGAGMAEMFGAAGVPAAVSTVVSVTIALVIANAVQMVFGELAPKNLAIAKTVALSRALSRPTLIYMTIASPLIRLFDTTANKLLRAVGIEPVEELPHGASPDDLHHIIEESRESGRLDDELADLLDRSLEFRELTVGQVMTPRVDVDAIYGHVPVSEVVEQLTTGRSRFPVLGDNIDDVIGVVGIDNVLTVPRSERATTQVRDIADSPLLLPESLPMPDVLERLRTEHRQQACVIDEYGGLAGIVTFEDVAEEVVGDIRDEEDQPSARPVRRADGAWLVPARWRVDEIEAETGIGLPEPDDYETLGGLVMESLGRVPLAGDSINVPALSWNHIDDQNEDAAVPPHVRIEVISVSRRVPRVLALHKAEAASDSEMTI